MTPTRYAIYVRPDPAEDWARFCTAWLGWDATTGSTVPHPDIDRLAVSALTAVPRRYGLHATIKPPFRLAPGRSEAALLRATEDLAADLPPVRVDGLALKPLGRFLALTIDGDAAPMNRMAADAVRKTDHFRARPTEQELERRRTAKLTAQQERNLTDWGYPYVLDCFRFHITLTGQLPREERDTTHQTLEKQLNPLLPRPYLVRDLALMGEDEEGFFHLIKRFPLGG